MIEGERETVRGRERAQCGMNGCSAMLLLQSYYNENSTFLRNPLAYFVSEPMWLNHHTGRLSAETQRDRKTHQGDTVPRERPLLSCKRLRCDCVPQVVYTSGVRGWLTEAHLANRDGDTLPQTDAEDSIQLLSRRGLNNGPGGPAWLTNITKRHESLCFYNHLLATAYYQLSSQSKARRDTTACYLICIWSKFKWLSFWLLRYKCDTSSHLKTGIKTICVMM